MFCKTMNAYGDITISNKSIALIASRCAMDCYGVVDMMSRNMFQSIQQLLSGKGKILATGVKVVTNENRITIDLSVILKYGVNVSAVAKSLTDSIKYNIEDFSGMIVDKVNVHVSGVRV